MIPQRGHVHTQLPKGCLKKCMVTTTSRPLGLTAEILVTLLHSWSEVSLSEVNDALEILVNFGLITGYDVPPKYYELSDAGSKEAEHMLKS